jgi:hypothetical protein
MPVNFVLKGSSGCQSQNACLDKFGCPPDRCPDFIIRRHDTKPALKIAIDECNGPFDFRGLVIEVNMWALAKLKADLTEDGEYFRLADDIGFEQVMVGDIIVMDRVRMPERMLVTAFDETNKLIKVQRGYHATTPSVWKKGTTMRIFRILNGSAQAEVVLGDVQDVDGTTERDVLQESYLVYEWQAADTCLPGCYWLEFKVLKMIDTVWFLPGGHWTGETNVGTDGYFYTGSDFTEASVRLSYDQVSDFFLIPDAIWGGAVHLQSDGNYYTGPDHEDGSVILNKTGVPSTDDTEYNSEGAVGLVDASIIPSFSDEDLTPADYGCVLGEGVEWTRRFPVSGEGFLIKVESSPTSEI